MSNESDNAKPESAESEASVRDHVLRLFGHLEEGLFERGQAIRFCLLAAMAGESVFLLGPPGVAKSLVARRLRHAFADAQCFDYLMGRFSTPEELFGPVSINRLKNDDVYVRRTRNYLPEADIVFLDEIWKASPPIQNTLLTALNEKIFRNGEDEVHIPLKLLIGASNETGTDESSRAFWDRFLVRLALDSLRERDNFVAMLQDSADPYRDTVPGHLKLSRETWQSWRERLAGLEMDGELIALIVELRERLADALPENSRVSDRRWKKIAGLLKASAFCSGENKAGVGDAFVIEHCVWDTPEQRELVSEIVRHGIGTHANADYIARSRSSVLFASIEADLAALGNETFTSTQPVLFDSEYFVFDSFPDALRERLRGLSDKSEAAEEGQGDGSSGPAGDLELRIWKGDFEALGAEPMDTELFVFERGEYLGTITQSCAKAPPWSIAMGRQELNLRLEQKKLTRKSSGGISEAQKASFRPRFEEFFSTCEEEGKTGLARIASKKEELARHPFVPESGIDILLASLRGHLELLSGLDARAKKLAKFHGI